MGTFLVGLALFIASAALCAGLTKLMFPLMRRYALARPNALSSHKMPTPQGGGMAVIASLVVIMALAITLGVFDRETNWHLIGILSATMFMAVLGAVDDIRPLPVFPRLVAQFFAVALMLYCLPPGARVLPDFVPTYAEQALLLMGSLWFVNLTNFMDGIDWITVVEVVPVATGVAVLLFMIDGELSIILAALVLAGTMVGFAPYNRHPAKLFLGDDGSLPIGLLLSWMLIALASAGHLAAAFLLPLYYIADATITLLRRWHRGETLSEGHRSHFYQIAVDRSGLTVPEVTTRIFFLNLVLAGLACLTVWQTSMLFDVFCILAGCAATAVLLRFFERGRM